MDLADPTLFSPARLADKRTLGPGPLVNHPAPEAKKERLLRLWTPPLPPRVQPHLWIGSVVQWGLNGLIRGLQVPHQVSQFDIFEIRSTPGMQLFRVSPQLNEGAQRKCTGWIEHKPAAPSS